MEPLAEVISLLRPKALGTKVVRGGGRWCIHRSYSGHAGFGLVLMGSCWLAIEGYEPLLLTAGDFVLMPSVPGFAMASSADFDMISQDLQQVSQCQAGATDAWYGDQDSGVDFKQLGGYFQLDAGNRALLDRLLPSFVHIESSNSAASRAKRTIDLIMEEALADRPARDIVIDRLLEILLIEALRFRTDCLGPMERPGLLTGLGDPLIARALNRIHNAVAHPWSVEELAKEVGLSRSKFSERFSSRVGIPPIQYLIEWRMTLAKDMLLNQAQPLERIADAIGYRSASAFSTAFRREVGCSPSYFARAVKS